MTEIADHVRDSDGSVTREDIAELVEAAFGRVAFQLVVARTPEEFCEATAQDEGIVKRHTLGGTVSNALVELQNKFFHQDKVLLVAKDIAKKAGERVSQLEAEVLQLKAVSLTEFGVIQHKLNQAEAEVNRLKDESNPILASYHKMGKDYYEMADKMRQDHSRYSTNMLASCHKWQSEKATLSQALTERESQYLDLFEELVALRVGGPWEEFKKLQRENAELKAKLEKPSGEPL